MDAVRYYSRSGNTKALADAIAEALGVDAVSVDAEDATLSEQVNTLFVGGALYAYGIDKHLRSYLQEIDPLKVTKAVVFSTSWISKHALDLIRRELEAKDITVSGETIYAKGMPDAAALDEAGRKARYLAS